MLPERGFAESAVDAAVRECATRDESQISAFRPPRSAAIAPAPMTGAAICASRAMQNSSLARRWLSIEICDSICLFVKHFGRRSSIFTVSRHNSKAPTIVR
jgi:hypothetical protein